MESRIFSITGKQAASPFVGWGHPVSAVKNKPPHNIVHMALGGREQILTKELLINNRAGMNGRSIEMPNATCT